MVEYNLWMPGDGNQNLTSVDRDYLEVFREIMRDSRWKDHFDLVVRAIFENHGRHLIGPPSSARRVRLDLGTQSAKIGNGCPGGDDAAVFQWHVHGRERWTRSLLPRVAKS